MEKISGRVVKLLRVPDCPKRSVLEGTIGVSTEKNMTKPGLPMFPKMREKASCCP
jgi:hypothetical protein